MGWEFAALWLDEPERAWKWVWRRVADDDGAVLQQSAHFAELDDCLAEARKNGFADGDCPVD